MFTSPFLLQPPGLSTSLCPLLSPPTISSRLFSCTLQRVHCFGSMACLPLFRKRKCVGLKTWLKDSYLSGDFIPIFFRIWFKKVSIHIVKIIVENQLLQKRNYSHRRKYSTVRTEARQIRPPKVEKHSSRRCEQDWGLLHCSYGCKPVLGLPSSWLPPTWTLCRPSFTQLQVLIILVWRLRTILNA